MKYYFFSSFYSAYGGKWKPQVGVCNEHPFVLIDHYNKMEGYETRLMSFQEITKGEYDLYKDLEDQI